MMQWSQLLHRVGERCYKRIVVGLLQGAGELVIKGNSGRS